MRFIIIIIIIVFIGSFTYGQNTGFLGQKNNLTAKIYLNSFYSFILYSVDEMTIKEVEQSSVTSLGFEYSRLLNNQFEVRLGYQLDNHGRIVTTVTEKYSDELTRIDSFLISPSSNKIHFGFYKYRNFSGFGHYTFIDAGINLLKSDVQMSRTNLFTTDVSSYEVREDLGNEMFYYYPISYTLGVGDKRMLSDRFTIDYGLQIEAGFSREGTKANDIKKIIQEKDQSSYKSNSDKIVNFSAFKTMNRNVFLRIYLGIGISG
jgi:hypothetical protein